MRFSRLRVREIFLTISLLMCPQLPADADNKELASIVGIYDGEIESLKMVLVQTEFFFESGVLVGKYKYEDQGGWDDTGKLFNIRVAKTCGGASNQGGGTLTQGGSASEDDDIVGLFGAAGKLPNKQSNLTRVGTSMGKGELCITGIWRDKYGQGTVKLRFSPTRDSFSGYYRSPGDEWAIWDGRNIPSEIRLGEAKNNTESEDKSERRVVSTEAETFYKDIHETGIGETKEFAIKEAYFFALQNELTSLVGYQAEDEVGGWFRTKLEHDFDNFKKRYFTPETAERQCIVNSGAKHVCTVEGRLKLAALKADMRKVVKTKERVLADKLVFFLSSDDAVAIAAEKGPARKENAEYFVDQLEGVFVRRGHRIVFGQKGLQAINEGAVDYGLEVGKIDFIDIKKGQEYTSGAVTVVFKLTHMESTETLANIPITEVTEVPGDIEAVLVAELSQRVSEKIARRVTESVINFQREQDEESLAKKKADTGQKTFFLRLVGLEKKNRKELRALRKTIKAMFPDSAPASDPGQSNANQVTVLFSTAQDVNHDDLLDFFYETYEDLPGFDAEYIGNNEYSLYFQLAVPKPVAVPEKPVAVPEKKDDAESSGKTEKAKKGFFAIGVATDNNPNK